MIRHLILALSVAALLSAAELPTGLFVAQAPPDAVDVIAARTAPTPGATVTVRGIIGGRQKPFVDGRALFTIMDRSLVCETACGTGWSGCGQPPEDLRGAVASVQVVDAAGKPLLTTLAEAGGLIPGAAVIVQGTVAAGSNPALLVITAQAIHRLPEAP